MWKIVSDDIFSQIENGKLVKFQSKETFEKFIKELGQGTGLFIDKDIYKKDLTLAFEIKQSICKESGYNYGSIELNWTYKVVNNSNLDNTIVY